MSPQRWQKVREAFDKAVACPPSEAEEVLREACGDDADLYEQVRRMLGQHERSSPLDQAVWERGSLGVFSAGQTVAGRYRIVRYLSRGGMGEVYEAEDLELGGRVAVKTLLPEIARDTRMIARFKQEIHLSREISDPHVCRVFDLSRHPLDGSSADTVFFLTMEFLAGETLAARLEREGRMTPAEALPLLAEVGQALDAAHRKGVVHRDLKPSNVMLTEAKGSVPPRAVVTDFGLARRSVPEKETTASLSGRIMGTVDYMAPELLTGAQATYASDIYALGMVAYKMVTGALPFASDTPLAAAILRSKEPIPSPKAFVAGLEPKWERAILRALDANPARRFTTAAEFIGTLRGDSTAITFAMPEMNRRKWAALAAVVVLAVGGWFGWRARAGARLRPSPEAETLYRKGVDDIAAGAYFAATKALDESVKLAPHFALGHARLAEAWIELDMPENAQEQMLLALREDVSRLSKMDRLQIEAIDLTITREFPAAAAKYEQMAKLAGADSPELAVDLGLAYEKALKSDKAIEWYRRAAEGSGHNPAAWLRLGVLYTRQLNAGNADRAFAEAARLYQLTSNLEGLTEVAYQQGIAANRRAQAREGAAYLQKALETARAGGDSQQEIRIKLQLATNAYVAGDGALAESYAKDALATAEANQLGVLAVVGILNLGSAYMRKGDAAGAERYYQNALALARSNRSPQLAARSQLYLASFHDQTKHPDLVMQEAREALAFFQKSSYTQETFSCLMLLGRAERNLGSLQQARTDFERLLKMAEVSHDRSQIAGINESLGTTLADLEDYPAALDHYRKSRDEIVGDERLAYADVHIARMLVDLGTPDEAPQLLGEAEARGKKFPAVLLQSRIVRARLALTQDRNVDAVEISHKALSSASSPTAVSELQAILCRALVGAGKPPPGLQACQAALDALADTHVPAALFSARMSMLEARVAARDTEGARKLFDSIQPELDRYPESRWRALAMASHFDPRYTADARKALAALAAAWGQRVFDAYTKRPDLVIVARPLLTADHANAQ